MSLTVLVTIGPLVDEETREVDVKPPPPNPEVNFLFRIYLDGHKNNYRPGNGRSRFGKAKNEIGWQQMTIMTLIFMFEIAMFGFLPSHMYDALAAADWEWRCVRMH